MKEILAKWLVETHYSIIFQKYILVKINYSNQVRKSNIVYLMQKPKKFSESFIILVVKANLWSLWWNVFYATNNIRKPKHLLITKTRFPLSKFSKTEYNFNIYAKFTLVEKIRNTSKPKDVLQYILSVRENLWMKTVETLYPHGWSQELNPE